MRRLCVIIGLCLNAAVFAADDDMDKSELPASSKVPRIIEHSNPESLEVVVGDSVALQAKASGATSLQWFTQDRMICKGESCSFSTEGWSLGVHNIVFVASNKSGSQSVTFPLRVKSKQVGRAVQTLTPALAGASAVESLGGEDFYLRARRGLSFVYQADKRVQILGSMPRKMEWNERFRSSGGVLQFGQDGVEEHSLLSGSYARLGKRGERRVIDLEDGVVRLRQIKEAPPAWSMVAGDWLQVDGDRKADIIVRLGKHAKDKNMPIARIATLRGQARVWYKTPTTSKTPEPALTAHEDKKAQAPQEMKMIVIPAGTSIILDFASGEEPVLRLPPEVLFEKVMAATTPSYLDPLPWAGKSPKARAESDDDNAEVARDVHVLDRKDLPTKADEALKQARVAMAGRDAIATLELLLPFQEKRGGGFEISLLLGRAYRQLGLYEQAAFFLQAARDLDPRHPEPPFQLGLLALEFGKWRQARDAFASAEGLNHPDAQAVYYYGGYARYQLNAVYRAREFLNRSLWDENDPQLAAATRALLRELDGERSWEVRTRLSVLYDSNVLRKPAGSASPSRVAGSRGAALAFDLGIGSTYLKSESGYFGAGFDFNYVGWLAQDLKSVDTALQKLHTDFGFLSGDAFALDGQVYLGSYVIGGQRVDDGLGLAVTAALPWFVFEPELLWDISMWVDPMPNRDDVLDPFLWEVVVPSDRSARRLKFGLRGLIHRGEASEMRAQVAMIKHNHTASLITVDDYAETFLSVDYDVRYSNRVRFGALGSVASRVFQNSPDNRKDTTLNVRGDARYAVTPFLSFDGSLGIWNQSSSRAANKYTKFLLTSGIGLEL